MAYSAQRGVIASLALANEQQLVVHWHAVDESGAGDAEISATVGGQVVAADDIEQSSKYPDRSSVVLLIDASGAGRETPLRQEKALLVQVATRAQERRHVDVAVYADAVQLLQPRDTSAATLNSLVDPLTVHDAPAYLGHALAAIIQLPPLFGVERRAIFVFTDGHADDAINAEKLIKSAAEHETSINFVLSRSDRSVNPSLTEIARATGGIVVNEANRSSFLESPFALLDSWATARFPMRLHPLMFWESAPEVQAILHRNSGDVRVSASIPLPPATARQTASYLVDAHSVAIAGSGVTIAVAAAGLLLVRSRGRSDAATARALPVLAFLEDLENGKKYPARPKRGLAAMKRTM